jgi:small subunit ribosomal protein S14
MAKISSVRKNNRRKVLIDKKNEERKKLKSILRDNKVSFKDRFHAQRKLSELPRNSSKVRHRNRCAITGRPRGYIGFFGLSRIMVRSYASFGMMTGVRKSSW